MRKLIMFATILLTIISCSQNNARLPIEQMIHNIENGLVEFTEPKAMFQAESTTAENRKTLLERMDHYKVPGVSIAVINNFKLEWAKSYGIIKEGSEKQVTAETFFQAASTSKLITTAIVLHFVQEKILNLDEDVNEYLRSWKMPENHFTKEHKVTLRLLLTHQAGLPSTNFPQEENAADPSLVQVLRGELPAMNKPAIAEYIPGTKWQYSNIGFVVIQQILEDVSNKPFDQLAKEIVFEALGMQHSTFIYPLKQELQENEAMPHDKKGTVHNPMLPPSALAHGGLLTTPSDLAIFAIELMRAYQGMSNHLLSEELAHQLFHRGVELDLFGMQSGQGLGAVLYGNDEGFIFVLPGSNIPGMNCWLLDQPKTGKGAVMMTNGALGEVLAMEIIPAVIREYHWLPRNL